MDAAMKSIRGKVRERDEDTICVILSFYNHYYGGLMTNPMKLDMHSYNL